MSDRSTTGFEPWDTESANLLDGFDTEREALEAVGALIALNGPGGVSALALIHPDAGGRANTVAMGNALAEHVRASAGPG
jgi:hypothetical protein